MAKKGNLGQKQSKEEVQRPIRFKKYEYLFLIVCEDQNTEPAYFRHFAEFLPPETMYVRPVGTGLDPKGVAERAVIEKNNLEAQANREVDYIWIVFDIDDADINDARFRRFNEAFEKAKEQNFKVAWSNEVFELWLLLHLTNIESATAMSRQEIYQAIQVQVRQHHPFEEYVYIHGNVQILEIIYQIGNEIEAIERARRLVAAHGQRSPINANPCTQVHSLLIELRGWITYYNYDPNN